MKKLLHVGCGPHAFLPPREFETYKEVRLDLDPNVQPDVVASIVSMPMVESESMDAIFCSHTLEHLHGFEVGMAMREFCRVLKEGGVASIAVPDLQSIGAKLALDMLDHAVYMCPVGPITPMDMIYGHQGAIGTGNIFMAHKTGFTKSTIKRQLEQAGFGKVDVIAEGWELRVKAYKGGAMPTKSRAERGYLEAHFGHEWVKAHHYDNPTRGLPYHVKKKKPKKKRGKK